ncbi:hypothetical protein F5Y14DRAFT_129294 [Nemania sp. NC0429]|nr:hypothetical protein F5Y14DRAFT_129294 [Nemania sp. NC0429]
MDQQAAPNNRQDTVDRTIVRGPITGHRPNRPVEFGRENASACVAACFEELLPNVEEACRQLQQPEYQRTRLWDLYCCDSINCGVYIGNTGQSPNVDLIINECQNNGYYSIQDPGPPATNYCTSSTPNTILTGTSLYTQTTGPSVDPELRTRPPDSASLLALPPTQTPESYTTFIPTSTSSPASAKAHSSRLTEGAKAAIVVISIIAVLAITAFLLFLFRWRRRSPRSSSPGPPLIPYNNQPYPGLRSGSQTPLITPPPSASSSRGTQLTPPAKLSDRKYLQPVLKRRAPTPLALSGLSDETLPSSPIRSPKPVHQHRRGATTSNLPLPTDTTAAASPHHPPSSIYSSGSRPDASTTTIGSRHASSVHSGLATVTGISTPPASAKRLPQAHDRPLEPSGPPPNRALPAPPPNHPNSPTFSVTPLSPRSPTFPTLPSRSPARSDNPIVPKEQQRNTTGPSASTTTTKELCELTESYAQEARESWGSWSGVGGGGPGVVPPSRKRGSASKDKDKDKQTAVAMQELDLEKLSGRY